MKPSFLIRILGLIIGLLFIGVTVQAGTTLTSVKTDKPILLSGVADNAWQKAAPLKVTLDNLPYEPNNGYAGMQETTVTIKSLYDDKYIYFLLQYKDPTESLERFPISTSTFYFNTKIPPRAWNGSPGSSSLTAHGSR
jgi:hypothetical protein